MLANKTIRYIIIGGAILAAAIFFYLSRGSEAGLGENENQATSQLAEVKKEPEFRKEKFMIESGNTYGVVMEKTGLEASVINAIYNAAKPVYDLAQIRAGYEIELVYGFKDGIFRGLVYKLDSEEELFVYPEGDGFEAEIRDIAYETRIVEKSGTIESSLYVAALNQGIDERAIIGLADAFQWTIDFAMDPRVGDTFRLVYEERYLDDEYIAPGRVLAGWYVNAGTEYAVFYFEENEENSGYFDAEGNSVQKMFLKAPVAFKYISSGFTTGKRYVEAFNVSTGHRAIDYAAPLGTPIRAVGDGTVTLAGWNGSYGNMVSVRHHGTYSTNYAHMSKMAVKRGAKVKQGDIIDYVGSTGFSTGPHLHYEMVKNGTKVNPLAEVLPPGESLSAESKERFLVEIAQYE